MVVKTGTSTGKQVIVCCSNQRRAQTEIPGQASVTVREDLNWADLKCLHARIFIKLNNYRMQIYYLFMVDNKKHKQKLTKISSNL